jgi:hypothetical protein
LKNFVTFRRGITPVHSAKMRPKKSDDYASNDEKDDNVHNEYKMLILPANKYTTCYLSELNI